MGLVTCYSGGERFSPIGKDVRLPKIREWRWLNYDPYFRQFEGALLPGIVEQIEDVAWSNSLVRELRHSETERSYRARGLFPDRSRGQSSLVSMTRFVLDNHVFRKPIEGILATYALDLTTIQMQAEREFPLFGTSYLISRGAKGEFIAVCQSGVDMESPLRRPDEIVDEVWGDCVRFDLLELARRLEELQAVPALEPGDG